MTIPIELLAMILSYVKYDKLESIYDGIESIRYKMNKPQFYKPYLSYKKDLHINYIIKHTTEILL